MRTSRRFRNCHSLPWAGAPPIPTASVACEPLLLSPCASKPGHYPRHCRQLEVWWASAERYNTVPWVSVSCHANCLTLVTHQDLSQSPQPPRIRLRIIGMVGAVAAQESPFRTRGPISSPLGVSAANASQPPSPPHPRECPCQMGVSSP